MASPNLRSRTNIPTNNNKNASSPPPTAPPPPAPKPNPTPLDPDDEGPTHLTLLDILRILAGLLLLSTTLSYFITGSLTWNLNAPFLRPARIKAWLVNHPPPSPRPPPPPPPPPNKFTQQQQHSFTDNPY